MSARTWDLCQLEMGEAPKLPSPQRNSDLLHEVYQYTIPVRAYRPK